MKFCHLELKVFLSEDDLSADDFFRIYIRTIVLTIILTQGISGQHGKNIPNLDIQVLVLYSVTEDLIKFFQLCEIVLVLNFM